MGNDGMKVEDFFYAIKKRYKMILIIILVSGVVMFALFGRNDNSKVKVEPPLQYEINSRIYIDSLNENNDIDARAMNNLSEVLKSREFIQGILDETKSTVEIDILINTLGVILVPDSQIIKFAIVGQDEKELIKLLTEVQRQAIEISPTIIKNSEVKVIEQVGRVNVMRLAIEEGSNKNKIVIIMSIIIFASFMLAFLLEYLDNTVKEGSDIESQFNLNLLGRLTSKNSEKEYIKVRTSIKYSANNSDNNIIAVANSNNVKNDPDISMALSNYLSKIECKTLIINSKVVNNNDDELLSCLKDIKSLDNVIKVENSFLDSVNLGNASNKNFELLDSKYMDQVLVELKSRYEYIIIDIESINKSEISQILVAKADSVILLAKSNKTKNINVEKSLRIINKLNTYPIGVILY